jgi:hypothetical protein
MAAWLVITSLIVFLISGVSFEIGLPTLKRLSLWQLYYWVLLNSLANPTKEALKVSKAFKKFGWVHWPTHMICLFSASICFLVPSVKSMLNGSATEALENCVTLVNELSKYLFLDSSWRITTSKSSLKSVSPRVESYFKKSSTSWALLIWYNALLGSVVSVLKIIIGPCLALPLTFGSIWISYFSAGLSSLSG